MKILRTCGAMRRFSGAEHAAGRKISFVPTMGYLHAGHLSLVKRAAAAGDTVVVSIFVNPTQFGPGEDLDRYPRDLKRDLMLLRQQGYCSAVFVPPAADMYAPDASTEVSVAGVSGGLCGASRPGHFTGVATVVAKLFNLVRPHSAVFGSKDLQQSVVIRRMVRDLDFNIRIIVAPIVREADGLAMSSRNRYLSAPERERALTLNRTLKEARARIRSGKAKRTAPLGSALKKMIAATGGVELEYLEIVDAETLRPVATLQGTVAVVLAARVGKTRLIDNTVVRVP